MGNVVTSTLHLNTNLITYQHVFWFGLNQSDYFPSFWCDSLIKISLFVFPNLGETGSVPTSASSFQCDIEHFSIFKPLFIK